MVLEKRGFRFNQIIDDFLSLAIKEIGNGGYSFIKTLHGFGFNLRSCTIFLKR
jgi:hypothetical protein